jgi:hypothetical protein
LSDASRSGRWSYIHCKNADSAAGKAASSSNDVHCSNGVDDLHAHRAGVSATNEQPERLHDENILWAKEHGQPNECLVDVHDAQVAGQRILAGTAPTRRYERQ